MIDLYGMTSPNVQKVRIMLEETELPYRLILLNVHKGDQYKPEFAALNPNCKVPVIVDHDGPDGKPYTVFESGAILLYLAEKAGMLLPKKASEKYDVLQWLMIQLTTQGPMFGQFVHFNHFTEGHPYAAERYASEVRRIYDLLETRLNQTGYLGGAEYSIADVAAFPWIRVFHREFGDTHEMLRIGSAGHPKLNDWFERIHARPGVQRALAGIDATKKTYTTATPEELDRYFGRAGYARSLH